MTAIASTGSRVSWDIPKQIFLSNKRISISGNHTIGSDSNATFIANVVPKDNNIVITQSDHFYKTSSRLIINSDNFANFGFIDLNSFNPFTWDNRFNSSQHPDELLPINEIYSGINDKQLTQVRPLVTHYQGCLEVLKMLHEEAVKASS